ncbi:hypothetical protein DFS34DRAFT_577908 [Phlyctochytrium arcticum]|nr:hypothetical protein DFS34DRAFT_654960 [Phlyctochytrium arcticum]KAI9088483.1 hypothetical protein DFS34DRAFT_654938 [Phlyctochytrium arcticum]KAI9101880.1 hypothetical protein DFS34DRAFT_577908 [Phlyctochytrium arcticum]
MSQKQQQEQVLVEKIRVGCVPEHFSAPLYQALAADAYQEKGLEVEIVSCPGGTGEMTNKLNDGEIDVAIALTEGLISNIVNNRPSWRIIGTYVQSPLTWSIASNPATAGNLPREAGEEAWPALRGKRIGISRYGSGSHLIPYVLADKMGWFAEDGIALGTLGGDDPFTFVELKNITGLVEGVTSGKIDVFLWERIMTKPYYDSGKLHHLSNITPPWPAFLFAATEKVLKEPTALQHFLDVTTRFAHEFYSHKTDGISTKYVAEKFHLPPADVDTWFAGVQYPKDTREVSTKVINECVRVLKKAGVIVDVDAEFEIGEIVSEDVCKLG